MMNIIDRILIEKIKSAKALELVIGEGHEREIVTLKPSKRLYRDIAIAIQTELNYKKNESRTSKHSKIAI